MLVYRRSGKGAKKKKMDVQEHEGSIRTFKGSNSVVAKPLPSTASTHGSVAIPVNPRSGSAFPVERDTTLSCYWLSCYEFTLLVQVAILF